MPISSIPIIANRANVCIGYSRLVYMLDTMYQYEIKYSCPYRGVYIQVLRLKQYHEATKNYKQYYYKSLYEYIDSYWYVYTLVTKSTIALIGIIRLCTIVIQCIIARIMPSTYKNSLYRAKYMVLLVILVVLVMLMVLKQ